MGGRAGCRIDAPTGDHNSGGFHPALCAMRRSSPRALVAPLDTTRLVREPAGADDHMITRFFFLKDYGSIKRYSVVQHPPETIAKWRKALRGESVKHTAVMSSVLERLSKFFGELQYRELLAGRPCIVLEDNQGSQATINSGYSANVLLQAIQLASNLRQSVDEAPMEAFVAIQKI